MGRVIGIDLGTTNSCVATMEGGEAVVIPNAEGERTTPSVVAFLPGGSGRPVGAVAKRQAVTNPTNTIFSIKRFMGRKAAEISEDEQVVPYAVVSGDNGDARVRAGGGVYSPPEISALILQKLKADAEAYLGEEVSGAVITVPAYFNDAQRQATKDAGRIAGLQVRRIINEPTAASLAYGMDKTEDQTILVFDLGGGTFDVSILEIASGVIEVAATAGDNQLGGDNFDKALVDWLVQSFQAEHGIDLSADRVALQRLFEAAEKTKKELSSALTSSVDLPFIATDATGPKHLSVQVSREQLEELCAALLDRVVAPVRQAIDDAADKGVTDLDHIVLVGGMTRMPAVRAKVVELTGKEPRAGVNPDEVVAVGAAVQAGVLTGQVKDLLLLDVTPLTLGVETKGGLTVPMIERNTTIPTRRSEIFSTAMDNQATVEIHVVQGERQMADDNKSLGRLQLGEVPKAPRGVPQIEVAFDIDANGILSVSARELNTGKATSVHIEAGSGLSEEEIGDMVAAAKAHAAEDRLQREVIEARNVAEQVLHGARRRLGGAQMLDGVDPASVAALQMAISELSDQLQQPGFARDGLKNAAEQVQQALYELANAEAEAEAQRATATAKPGA